MSADDDHLQSAVDYARFNAHQKTEPTVSSVLSFIDGPV